MLDSDDPVVCERRRSFGAGGGLLVFRETFLRLGRRERRMHTAPSTDLGRKSPEKENQLSFTRNFGNTTTNEDDGRGSRAVAQYNAFRTDNSFRPPVARRRRWRPFHVGGRGGPGDRRAVNTGNQKRMLHVYALAVITFEKRAHHTFHLAVRLEGEEEEADEKKKNEK